MSLWIRPENLAKVDLSPYAKELNDNMSTHLRREEAPDPTTWFSDFALASPYVDQDIYMQAHSHYRPLRSARLAGLGLKWRRNRVKFLGFTKEHARWECSINMVDGNIYQFIINIPRLNIDTCIYLWPQFRHADWQNYILWDMNELGINISAFTQDSSGVIERIFNNSGALTYQHFGQAPDLLEMTRTDGLSVGCFFLEQKIIENGEARVLDLAVDLGSANSTVASNHTGTNALIGFNIQSELCTLLPDLATETDRARGVTFGFLGSGLPNLEASKPIYALPTAPIHLTKANGDMPLAKVLPLFGTPDPEIMSQILARDWTCKDRFAFPSDIKWVTRPDDVRADYVNALATMAVANIINQEGRMYRVRKIVRTFPLSDDGNLGTSKFAKLGAIGPNAGSEDKSESRSNFDLIQPKLLWDANEYLIVLDLGGGTTDISFGTYLGPTIYDSLGPSSTAQQDKADGGEIPQGRFGGKFLHQLLESTMAVPDLFAQDAWKDEGRFAYYQQWARREAGNNAMLLREYVDTALRFSVINDRDNAYHPGGPIHNRIFVLFYSIFYYAMVQSLARSMTGNKPPEWKIFMAGSGWKLKRFLTENLQDLSWIAELALDAVCTNYGVEATQRPLIKQLAINFHLEVEKATVARGALASGAEGAIVAPPFRVAGATLGKHGWNTPWWPAPNLPAWDKPHTQQDDRAADFTVPSPFSCFTNTHPGVLKKVSNPLISRPLLETLESLHARHPQIMENAAKIIRALPSRTVSPGIIPTPLAVYFHSLHEFYLTSPYEPNFTERAL